MKYMCGSCWMPKKIRVGRKALTLNKEITFKSHDGLKYDTEYTCSTRESINIF